MKIKYKTVTLPDKYIAFDGTEFLDMYECEKYENNFNSKKFIDDFTSKLIFINFIRDWDLYITTHPIIFIDNFNTFIELKKYLILHENVPHYMFSSVSSPLEESFVGKWITWKIELDEDTDVCDIDFYAVDSVLKDLHAMRKNIDLSIDNIQKITQNTSEVISKNVNSI